MRSAMNIASSGSCVTISVVGAAVLDECSVSSRTWLRRRVSSPENGSSSSKHARLRRQRAGQRHALLLAARQCVRIGVA